MKQSLTFLFLLIFLASSSRLAYADAGLLANGGFEGGGGDPDSWTVNNSGIGAVFSRDVSVKRSGQASGKVVTERMDKREWPAYEQKFEGIKAGERYEAEAWIRTRLGTNVAIAYLALEFLGADGKRRSFVSSQSVSSDTDWSRVRIKTTIPADTTALRLRLILYGPGTAWFDDVALERNDHYEAQPVLRTPLLHLQATGKVFKESFGGFGAEIDPWLWNAENRAKGVTEEDAQLVASRVKEMRLSLARVFVWWSIFNPSGDRTTLDFQSDGMESLKRTLALCQSNHIEVIACNVEWGQRPWDDLTAATKALGELMDYLVKQCGFTCLRGWTLCNEPDSSWSKFGYDFDRYIQIHSAVRKELKRRGLDIAIVGSDDSTGPQWLTQNAKRMPELIDAYSSHHYVPHDDLDVASERTEMRLQAIRDNDPSWKTKKVFVTEFGLHEPTTKDRSNAYMRTYDCGLGIAAICLGQLALGIDGASIWCLHRIYYPGYNFMDYGLWEFKNENWKPRPVWYSYSLFTRFVGRGSRIKEMAILEKEAQGLVKTAFVENSEGRFLFILNLSYGDVEFSAQTDLAKGNAVPYQYTESSLTADRPLFQPGASFSFQGAIKGKIPKRSLAVYQIK